MPESPEQPDNEASLLAAEIAEITEAIANHLEFLIEEYPERLKDGALLAASAARSASQKANALNEKC